MRRSDRQIKQRRHRHPDGSLVETAELPDGRVIRVVGATGQHGINSVNSREMYAWLDWLKRNKS